MFDTIKKVAEDPASLVIILIDEVESIAFARDSVSAQEPSDSLRVVNAVLTQLDQLRSHSNVFVLTTSNLSSTIDLAFVDRADLKQYVGLPSTIAIFNIFKSAIDELIKVNILTCSTFQSRNHLFYFKNFDVKISFRFSKVEIVTNVNAMDDEKWDSQSVVSLLDISKKAQGLSGRALRKLPLLAHAWFIHSSSVDLTTFLDALDDAVDKLLADNIAITKKR